tara:strand:+ start:853 stop:1836 length:984 start_codon:yes stop_codon:yes gene_type:complete
MTIKEKIISAFEKSNELTAKELTHSLGASKQMVHLVLNELVEKQFIEKLGRAPKTIYRKRKVLPQKTTTLPIEITAKENDFLNANFLIISDMGNLLEGIEGFKIWCEKRNEPVLKTLHEFIKTKQKYESFYDVNGMINGSHKLISTYKDNTFLDEIFYLDFYAIERFGKTRLGTLLHYSKQGQNKFLMNIMMQEIKTRIITFINNHDIDAVGFVPPTIRREVQIMKFIQESLNLTLPVVAIKKISGIIPIPQKSLSKLDERIKNAENTFAVTEQRKFKKVLLIDDAVGSGSTLNQIAEKIKNKEVAKIVIGLAVVGSFKGFDVITDI